MQPDAPDTCKRTAPSNKCGLVPQCGCTLAETCDVEDSSGNVGCVTAGKAAMGAPCVATAGCALGLTCVFGTCHAFCDNPGSACTAPKTGGCIQVKSAAGAPIPNLTVCRVACDLRDVSACGGTTAAGTGVCMVDDNGATDCATGGTRTVNQTCTPTDECGPGLVCTLTGTADHGLVQEVVSGRQDRLRRDDRVQRLPDEGDGRRRRARRLSLRIARRCLCRALHGRRIAR